MKVIGEAASRRRRARVRRRRGHKGTTLLAVYAAASLLPVAILGVVLMRGYHEAGVNHALDQGRAQAAVIGQMAIAPALSGDLSAGVDAIEREALQKATDTAVAQGSVLRLRLLDYAGNIAFSDDATEVGRVEVTDSRFRATSSSGEVRARIVPAEGFRQSSIRVLRPVIVGANGEGIGVLEVFLPYDELAAQVAADTRSAIMRLALGLVSLYAVLALISWWTTRALGRHAAAKEHQALHDPLTGLPNRELFRRVTERTLGQGGHGALVLVDLDRFKEVNDTLGHHAGDELLQVVARRLTTSLRTDDTVARLGGDEFGILLPGEADRTDTVELLARVREELAAEILIDDALLSVDASFGICFFPRDADSVEDLLKRADAAMYQGKHGPTGVVVYEPSSARPTTDSLVMHRELRRALQGDELVLHYQPKLELSSGRVDCVEALVRWQHPERGLLPPAEFLPLAERSELIEPLTRWVLHQALEDCGRWTLAGHDWAVAVNVSARNLASLEFVDVVQRALLDSGMPADRLFLEITETAMAFDAGQARQVVEGLTALGVSMAIDDFGVGYTGLSQLRALDIREIKIDRAFIAHLEQSPQDRAIVASVIDLAHGLGCTVTAEGVESQEVADWLADSGCDHGQGYLWLRPSTWDLIVPVGAGAAPAGSLLDPTAST